MYRFKIYILLILSILYFKNILSSSDISNIELNNYFQRFPYIQKINPNSAYIVWRSKLNQPFSISIYKNSNDKKNIGKINIIKVAQNIYQYEAYFSNLEQNTKYFYTVSYENKVIYGNNKSCYFKTSPKVNDFKKLRFWAIGDSGSGKSSQFAVRDGMLYYINRVNRGNIDFLMHLGDMAYPNGTREEFDKNFFNPYKNILKNSVCWATFGNHEGVTSFSQEGHQLKGLDKSVGPYYKSFLFPQLAECGGFPSRTEAYYSFDYGPIHFISLNSHDVGREKSSQMIAWLKLDLKKIDKNKTKWLIAFWHHPPYSKGTHDGDLERKEFQMRNNVLPIIEKAGVDLVLTGHSHIYERSMLINNSYDRPAKLSSKSVINPLDGNTEGFYKKSKGLNANQGTVYIVAGHSGSYIAQLFGTSRVMKKSLVKHGSVLVDIDNDKLEARMIDVKGDVLDKFVIDKSDKNIITPQKFNNLKTYSAISGRGANLELIPPFSKWHIKKFINKKDLVSEKNNTLQNLEFVNTPVGYGDQAWVGNLYNLPKQIKKIVLKKKFDIPKIFNLNQAKRLVLGIRYNDAYICKINGQLVDRGGITRDWKTNQFITFNSEDFLTRDYIPLSDVASKTNIKEIINIGENEIELEFLNNLSSPTNFIADPMLSLSLIKRKDELLGLADFREDGKWEYIYNKKEKEIKFSDLEAIKKLTANKIRWKKADMPLGFGYLKKKMPVDFKNIKTKIKKTKALRLFARKKFNIKNKTELKKLGLAMRYDDAIKIYFNGKYITARGIYHNNNNHFFRERRPSSGYTLFRLGEFMIENDMDNLIKLDASNEIMIAIYNHLKLTYEIFLDIRLIIFKH